MKFKKIAGETIKNITQLTKGHTNYSYYLETQNNKYFYQKFVFEKFNHKLNYLELTILPFVPKIINVDKQSILTIFINGKVATKSIKNLCKIAKILKKTHNSKIKLPKYNIDERIKYYYNLLQRKKVPKLVFENYEKIMKLASSIQNINKPCHNDAWLKNFIIDEKKRIYLCDWEFATMNNYHFDLAYFITSSYLSKKEEEIFLTAYGKYDHKQLKICKILVFYITILWVLVQPKIIFPYKQLIIEMDKLLRELK